MKSIPGAVDLLATAREALTRDLLPALPADQRYVALMIANAMAIAARECRDGLSVEEAEIAGLQRLLPPADARAQAMDATALRRSLAEAIRAGRFDTGGARFALVQHLVGIAHDAVAISNPKALRADATDEVGADREDGR